MDDGGGAYVAWNALSLLHYVTFSSHSHFLFLFLFLFLSFSLSLSLSLPLTQIHHQSNLNYCWLNSWDFVPEEQFEW
jgi:hypothetical protein